MRLKYMFTDKKKTTPHPFHVKSSWQPPAQTSVALEKYLEDTKLELDSVVFNISANERKAIFSLKGVRAKIFRLDRFFFNFYCGQVMIYLFQK